MIVQTTSDGHPNFVIEQADHARMSGQLAAAFGNDRFAAPVPRELMIYVAGHHDEGWVPVAVLYFTVLSPSLTWLQSNVGDFVPPGELTGALGASLVPFFLANVLLAPFVEESLYRGYALDRLRQRYGLALAVVITCALFGLLHWAGGFWYILLTGFVAGGLFAGLRVWRRTLVAPFAAHLALNVLEFVWIWQAG